VFMNKLKLLLVPIVLTFALVAFAGDCATDVKAHLDWCLINHGYNEGATCGYQALTGKGIDLPANAGQQVLGNVWDRTNMMGATRAAWRVGAKDAAVTAAGCCQIHNPGAKQCLDSRPDLVKDWLEKTSH
jgi:hypothetical protein